MERAGRPGDAGKLPCVSLENLMLFVQHGAQYSRESKPKWLMPFYLSMLTIIG